MYGGPTTLPPLTATHTGIQFPSRFEAVLHFFVLNPASASEVGSGIVGPKEVAIAIAGAGAARRADAAGVSTCSPRLHPGGSECPH